MKTIRYICLIEKDKATYDIITFGYYCPLLQ